MYYNLNRMFLNNKVMFKIKFKMNKMISIMIYLVIQEEVRIIKTQLNLEQVIN